MSLLHRATGVCEQSRLFLCNHPSLQNAAKRIAQGQTLVVVCERKEDVPQVRAQLFYEVSQLQPGLVNQGVLPGVTTYTLDKLCAVLCAWFAQNQEFDNETKTLFSEKWDFKRPYLDVVNQEAVALTTLWQVGYTGGDARALGKQLVTLLDAPLPVDMNFMDLLLQAQSGGKRTIQQGGPGSWSETPLKQLCACFLILKSSFLTFNRFQELAKHYFPGLFHEHLQSRTLDKITGFQKFIQAHILWVHAPCYLNHLSQEPVTPGNFQAMWVNEVRGALSQVHHTSAKGSWESVQICLQNKLDHKNTKKQPPNQAYHQQCQFNYHVLGNLEALKNQCEQWQNQGLTDTCLLLGDFDLARLRACDLDARGAFTWTPALKALAREHLQAKKESPLAEQLQQITTTLAAHLKVIDLQGALGICRQFQLSWASPEQVLDAALAQAAVQVTKGTFLDSWAKPLQLFACARKPRHLVVCGRAHASRAASFHVGLLNDAIAFLRVSGVGLEPIAPDFMYRLFWQHLCEEVDEISFLLPYSAEIDEFPPELKPLSSSQIKDESSILNTKSFIELLPQDADGCYFIEDPKWFEVVNLWQPTSKAPHTLAVTQLEKYMGCPLRFYLSSCAQTDPPQEALLVPHGAAAGARVHRVAQVVGERAAWLRGAWAPEQIKSFLDDVAARLSDPGIVALLDKQNWKIKTLEIIENLLPKITHEAADTWAQEWADAVFDAAAHQPLNQGEQNPLPLALEIAMARRCIGRICAFLGATPGWEHHLTWETERNVSLILEDVVIAGRIDLLMGFSTDDARSLHIIDYKLKTTPAEVHKIKEKDPQAPTVSCDPASPLWSAQAALYGAALLEEQQQVSDLVTLGSFTLCYLKSPTEESNTNPQNSLGQGRRGRVSDVYTRGTQASDDEPNDARTHFQDWYNESNISTEHPQAPQSKAAVPQVARMNFLPEFSFHKEEREKILTPYRQAIVNLKKGLFPARPRNSQQCYFCPWNSLCPGAQGPTP